MKTRKLLAIMLAIAVLASFISVPVFAEGEGTALETLGILIGPDEDGVTPEYLATIATRAQAALIDLRLEGNEAAALAFDGEETFTDAADATEFWQPILEFLKATPASGWNGYEDGSFAPNAPITGMEFTKILLVSLGYVEGVDFMYEDVMDFAATVGLTALAEKADADLTVEDLAVAIVEALGTKTTAATDVTLLSQLVIDGVIDEADAVAAGFEVEEEALVIVAAYASAVNEVTVEMSTDVPEGTAITLKKGTAGYVVTEAVDGATVTLTALFNLPAGTYTVTVGEESADFEVMAQYATDLVIGADSLYLQAGEDLEVALLDQYGDAMSLTSTNYSVFNQSNGWVYTPTVGTTIEIDVNEASSGTEAGDVVYVFVYDPASMLTVSGELPVIAAPYLETLAIGGVTLGNDDSVRLTTGDLANVLDVTAYDQYGQAMTLTNLMFTTQVPYDYTAEVQVLSSNGDVISAGAIDIVGGEFTFAAGDAGMAMFTFIIPDQANIYTSEMITVYAAATLTTIEIAGPSAAVYATEAADFGIVGFDQYGATIDVTSAAVIDFTATHAIFSSNPAWDADNSGTLTVMDSDLTQTSTVYYFLGGIFQGTFDVTANATAYPFQVIGVDVAPALESGVEVYIMSGDISVQDQYGRTMTDPLVGDWNYEVISSTSVSVTMYECCDEYDFYADGVAGSDTFVAYLTFEGSTVTTSGFAFDITNVPTEDITGYAMTMTTEGTMYTGSDWEKHWDDADEEYYKYVGITGTYDGMSVVLLDENEDDLPDLIDLVTSTNDAVMVMSGNILVPTDAVDGTTTVKAWRNGAVVATADQALSDSAPDWTTTVVEAEEGTEFSEWYEIFDLFDQYGVQISYYLSSEDTSPDTLTPYVIQVFTELGDDYIYTIVKWDGSISATYTDVDGDDGFNPLP